VGDESHYFSGFINYSTRWALADGTTSNFCGGGVQINYIGVVPEPSTYLLMRTGLLGVLGLARRKRTA
jgi:hypothetical protein